MKSKVLLSFSGGLDSSSLLLRLLRDGQEPTAVSFMYNQKHLVEVECAKEIAAILGIEHRVVDLSSAFSSISSALLSGGSAIPTEDYSEENMKQTVVPCRNSIFLSVLYGMAETLRIQNIAIGVHLGDAATYPDCRESFVLALGKALELGSWWKASVAAPFVGMTKTQVIQDAVRSCRELQIDFVHVFAKTWTCYDPELVGRTPSCLSRILAFYDNEMKDPFPYPQGWDSALDFALSHRVSP